MSNKKMSNNESMTDIAGSASIASDEVQREIFRSLSSEKRIAISILQERYRRPRFITKDDDPIVALTALKSKFEFKLTEETAILINKTADQAEIAALMLVYLTMKE